MTETSCRLYLCFHRSFEGASFCLYCCRFAQRNKNKRANRRSTKQASRNPPQKKLALEKDSHSHRHHATTAKRQRKTALARIKRNGKDLLDFHILFSFSVPCGFFCTHLILPRLFHPTCRAYRNILYFFDIRK